MQGQGGPDHPLSLFQQRGINTQTISIGEPKMNAPPTRTSTVPCATGDANIHSDIVRIGSSTAFSTVLTGLSMSGTSNAPMLPAEVEALLNKIRVRSPRPGA